MQARRWAKESQKWRRVSVLGVILVGVLIIAIMSFYATLSEKTEEEQKTHLSEIAVKISRIVDSVCVAKWNMIENHCNHIYRHLPTDKAEVLELLDQMTEDLSVEGVSFYAFDDRSRIYGSGNFEGFWNQPDLLLEDAEARTTILTSMPGTSNEEEQLVFLARLREPVVLAEGNSITHLALVQDMEPLKEVIRVSIFGDQSWLYIINKDGSPAFIQKGENDFLDVFNILEALKAEEFTEGNSGEKLAEMVARGESATMEVVHQGVHHYLATVPTVEQKDWTVLLVVPVDVLSESMENYMEFVVSYFTIISAMIVGLLTITMYSNLRYRVNKELVESHKQANEMLDRAAQEAKAASEAKSTFLAHMSHDIRTPITGIIGMTEMAIKNSDNPERMNDCMNKVLRSANHLSLLINDVLDLSRIESGKTMLRREQVNLLEVLKDCETIVFGQLQGRDIVWHTDFQQIQHHRVLSDELRLKQIFINMLGNAIKFTPEGRSISFTAEELVFTDDKASFYFTIEDTGIGMSQEFIDRIFEPFSQENNEQKESIGVETKGTGLGMPIVKRFVELMGGSINVSSELGKGSKFTICLSMEIDKSEEGSELDKWEDISLEGMKIFLAEDNEINYEIIESMIEDTGATLTRVCDGVEAVEMFETCPEGAFDIILMDINMPRMDGIKATVAIRAMDRQDVKEIPILAMTANAFVKDMEDTKAAGMDDHLSKPIRADKLIRALKKYEGRKHNEEEII